MTKTIEIKVSISEVLLIVKQRWKLILVVVLICATVCGCFSAYKSMMKAGSTESVSEAEIQQYKCNVS